MEDDRRWQITRFPIVETESRPRRVVAAGSHMCMEAEWFRMIEEEDDFYLELAPVPRVPPRPDWFGRSWPDLDDHDDELCSTCGQPDNCGDCNHMPLTEAEARSLGAVI